MKSTLLAVRLSPAMIADLHDCPGLLDHFRVLAIGQRSEEDVRFAARGRPLSYLQDWPDESRPEATEALYRGLIASCRVTHAIVAQPLQWYSTVVDRVLGEQRDDVQPVRRFWTEAWFDRAYLDEFGALYMPENEARMWAPTFAHPRGRERLRSKFSQPEPQTARALHAELGPASDRIVVFGQVPDDMSLVLPNGELRYMTWLDAIFRANPGVRFLFKHHPLARTDLQPYANVTEVDVDVLSLLNAFPYVAAYSSTVISEAVARGAAVATGGHHAMFGLTVPIASAAGAAGLLERLRAHVVDTSAVAARLGFLEHRYSLRLSDPAVLDRLLIEPWRVGQWYERRA